MASSALPSARSFRTEFKVVRHYSKVLNQNCRQTFPAKAKSLLETIRPSEYHSHSIGLLFFCRSHSRPVLGKLRLSPELHIRYGQKDLFRNDEGIMSYHTHCRGCLWHTSMKRNKNALLQSSQIVYLCAPKLMSSGRSSTHYYDVLGLTPRASQKEIKTAYYIMSKKYHPDVTTDKKCHELFTEVSEAYEILGNIQKKRMYDKGMFNTRHHKVYDEGDYTQAFRDRARQSPFERGDRPPPPTGRSKIYNFDEFYRQHYNEIRERQAEELRETERFRQQRVHLRQNRNIEHRRYSALTTVCLVILSSVLMLIGYLESSSYDVDRVNRRKNQ